MSEQIVGPLSGMKPQTDPQSVWTREEAIAQARRQTALTISVLLFVGIYLWGLVWGLRSLTQRQNDTSTSQG